MKLEIKVLHIVMLIFNIAVEEEKALISCTFDVVRMYIKRIMISFLGEVVL